MKASPALLLAVALMAVACGGGDDESDGAASASSSTVPESTTSAPTTTAPAETAPADDGDDAVVNADPVLVDLADFEIDVATTTYQAGTINFEVTNSDDIPHEFGIARGPSYEELPLLENGSIDEDTLGVDYLGKTAVVDNVLAPLREISFTLEPGEYVFFCNLVVGPVSHAERGQVLSVTVVG